MVLAAWLGMFTAGCGNNTSTVSNVPTSDPSQLYFAPTTGDVYSSTYAIDHAANTFVRKVYGKYGSQTSPASGGTVTDSGTISKLSNGVISLETTYSETSTGTETTYAPPLTGNWEVELPGQAALVGMKAYTNFTPLVPTQSCPSLASATTFQFVTIPKQLSIGGTTIQSSSWNPQLETAFGSVAIATSGTTVQFSSVSQHTFPLNGAASGPPSNPGPVSATALCSQTYYGQTISVPGSVTVANPGQQQTVPPSATIGIGPSGFLVEDAGAPSGQAPSTMPPYENILGAGYGAIGLPKPSSPLNTSGAVAAQYQGFVFGSGGTATTSLLASFGYPSLQTACPTLPAPSTSTILYGGEFANNDPSANPFGNCDMAIDLGTQDANNNGLYPVAVVYVAASFPNNGIGITYSVPAVAIAGQIQGKYAVFLIGVDMTGSPAQAWGIYLLQSN